MRASVMISAVLVGIALYLGVVLLPSQPTFARRGTDAPVTAKWYGAPTPTLPPCSPDWRIVSSPNPGSVVNYLLEVAVVTTNDVWAVGYYSDDTTNQTLIEHWDGSSWSIVSSPSPGATDNELNGVAARAANDVWAVGTSEGTTLIEHWDGSSWTVTPDPNPGNWYDTALGSVEVVEANDVWAVGNYFDGNTNLTLIEHWDGSSWSIVPSPSPSIYGNFLNGVEAWAANDIWAVGDVSTSGSSVHTLIEHWDGSNWSVVASPDGGTHENYLKQLAAIAANDIWAVGMYTDVNPGTLQTLIEHWDGSSWSVVPSPHPGSIGNVLLDVAALAADDAWAVGSYATNEGATALVLHWDGSDWSIVPSDNTNMADNYLHGIVALTTDDMWSTGYSIDGQNIWTLTERYTAEICLTATPTATVTTSTPSGTPTLLPTQTPGSATATVTVTATGTATACPIQFTDVDQSNPFYSYIRCLACRGIVSGYNSNPPCIVAPCFQPDANVTRGQMSKFVSNAANYQDVIPATRQTFTDVPYGSPFWLYVERTYLHSVINGYTGGSSCTNGVPCYLPGNTVTRGQAAKFVSNAGDFSEPVPSTQQTFTDVPYGSPFWLFVERTYLHGVIDGYMSSPPCTTGVPCFLPGNMVTRGQTSKFIANTFYPECETLTTDDQP